ncbi:hypothetical protein [uncultured Polaribacter sp.]|uniref:hypothetical protein n=1 Tax=uncultured Polaribacter sp. TaxID=174711 RepID=UPI00262F97AA|nr:hypothetical protein [uncultured Polaribacter sp.]
MKKIIVFILALLLFSCQQKEKTPLDKYAFAVGTLGDYMGREKHETEKDLVEKYHPSEKKLYTKMDAMFQNLYTDLKLTIFENNKTDYIRYELRSKKLKDTLDAYYTYKYSGRGTAKKYIDFDAVNIDSLIKSKNFIQENYDSIFVGSLKSNVFKTNKQKLSFITGAYVRYGSQLDSLHQISVANSTSKVKTLEILLNDIGCTNVVYEVRPAIPYGHKVLFKPTLKLTSYFEKYDFLKK